MSEQEIQAIEDPENDHGPLIIVLHNQVLIGFVSEVDFQSFMDEKTNLLTVFDPHMYHLDVGYPCFHPFVEMSDDECYVFHRQHILTTAFPNDELLNSFIAFMERMDKQAKKEMEVEAKKLKDREELLKIINEPEDISVTKKDRKRTIH